MSKQLVMESYVDECLDEVEIRGLFIQEGIMDTPYKSLLDSIYNKIDVLKKRMLDIRSLYSEYGEKKIATHETIKKLQHSIETIDKSKHPVERAQKLLDIKNSIRNKKEYLTSITKEMETLKNESLEVTEKAKKLTNAMNKVRKAPAGILGDVPYLYQIIGATAIVAAIAYASYKLYKRFMSKAAKACKDKKGKVKTICMNKYQIKGLEMSKKPLTDGMRGCSKSKDIQKCKVQFNKKINAIDKKIAKKQNQIKKLMGR